MGGPLTVENPFVAKARLHRLRKYMPVSCNHLEYESIPKEMYWEKPLEASPWKLADNVFEAMQKMNEIKDIESDLESARLYYNGQVKTFNTAIELFPANLIVSGMGEDYKKRPYFEVDDETERKSVKVSF